MNYICWLEVRAHDRAVADLYIYPGAVLGLQCDVAASELVSSTTSQLVNSRSYIFGAILNLLRSFDKTRRMLELEA